jgi:hypothetical protein
VLLVAGSSDSELVFEAVRARNAEQPEQPLRVIGVDQDVSVVDAESSLVRSSALPDRGAQQHPRGRGRCLRATGQVWRGFYDGESGLVLIPPTPTRRLAPRAFPAEGCMTLSDAVREAAPAAAAAEKEQTTPSNSPTRSPRFGLGAGPSAA